MTSLFMLAVAAFVLLAAAEAETWLMMLAVAILVLLVVAEVAAMVLDDLLSEKHGKHPRRPRLVFLILALIGAGAVFAIVRLFSL